MNLLQKQDVLFLRGIIFNIWNTFTAGKEGKIIIKSFLSDNKSILKVKDKNRFTKTYM